MCGICGFTGSFGEDVLRDMRDVLAHRGPDEAGEFIERPVALGHRRLSIVDLAAGQQPMKSVDGSVVVVFNGEIYNHPLLKRELERRGRVYRSNCDTESIANAYLEYGPRCVDHLDGMFAFVLYDRTRRRLFGARDRFGKKPFFYSLPIDGGRRSFVFASEIRSLLRHPLVRRSATPSRRGIAQYLLHDYLPGKLTIFDDVLKLEAGHAFSIDLDAADAEPVIWRYWQNPIENHATLKITEADAAAELVRLLDESVQRRLMADVPLGVFLSGGIDSSAVAAVLAGSRAPRDIRSFSIGFEERSFDESPYAERVARALGTTHSTRTFSANDCVAEIERVAGHMDEPFADPSILPMAMLCRFARESVTVALGGDGGDELLAGYDPFAALRPAAVYDAVIPAAVHSLVVASARALAPTSGNMPLSFRVQRFLRAAKERRSLRLPTWMGPFDPPRLARLLPGGSDIDEPFAAEAQLYDDVLRAGGDDIQAGLAYFQRFYLTDDILVKADRASMMSSLEVRAPFLDTKLAEFVNRLPSRFKIRFGVRKYLLKRAFGSGARGGGLPREILQRPKKGFGIPVARWIRHELRARFRLALVDAWPSALEIIDRREVTRLLDAHVAGRENNYKELWALFMLGEWARRWAA